MHNVGTEDSMDKKSPDVKDSISELMGNIGTIGVFMLGEIRVLLKKSWGSSRQEFRTAVDQAATNLKRSGKLAVSDIETASTKIKDAWETLDKERNLDWDSFISDLKQRLKLMGSVSKEAFSLCVKQAWEVLDKQWTAFGRIGEDRFKKAQEQSGEIAKTVKDGLDSFLNNVQKTGRKLDKALDAAWNEIKKKD
jgi:hypothetical protein